MQVQPYLSFEGRCEEAIEFYKKALGAQVQTLLRFKDSPGASRTVTDGPFAETKELLMAIPPGADDKVLHASLRIGDTTLMASDGQCTGKPGFAGISLSLMVANAAEAERRFAALADAGQVQMPLTKTFFSPCFGMVADRFGMLWMIIVAREPSAPIQSKR